MTKTHELIRLETKLLKVRKNIADSLTNPEYDLQFFSKYPFNTTLVPASDGGYRFYIFSGVNVANVIPFGNDEQFNCDSTGKICSFVKIHPKLIATSTKGPNGEYLANISHNHDATAPFITSTDICIFLHFPSIWKIVWN